MRSTDVRRLEEITLNSSSALKQMIYDGWVLRFSPGSNVKRANSVTALYPSTLNIDDKLALCEAAYAKEGLPVRFRVNEFSDPPDLDARLAARGYEKIEPTVFMMLPLTENPPGPLPPGVSELALEDWLEVNHRLRGNAKETIAAHRARLESIPLPCFPVALAADGTPVSAGLGALQDGHFGLFDIFTPEAGRSRGYARLLTLGLLHIAEREHARLAYLQVDESNAPARRIYEGLGFRAVYRYWYRVKPS